MADGRVSDRRKEKVRAKALDLGFRACGFASAEPLDCGSLLREWLAHGRHGRMDYLARDVSRRLDPRAVLPSVATIVVAAWPYRPAARPQRDWRRALTGRIAAYALGPDYHDELDAALSELGAYIGDLCDARSRPHVDAGPLVEKDLARRAGIGWFGHNTNILSRSLGSYFLIGCLLTDASFEPDPPFIGGHCGTCTACRPACPTGALDDGPTIDARRCISYLTIEHRGPIDRELRPLIENWVFGCDVCQEVCPWNDGSSATTDDLVPSLPELLALSRGDFDARYRRTAVARAKLRGLARNAAVAMGNSGNAAAVDPLASAVRGHEEALVRAHAAWGLGRLATPAARAALVAAERSERVPPVREEIDAALASAPAGSHAAVLRGGSC